MNRIIKIPMQAGNMTLHWDSSLFTAVVPQTDSTSLLIYAGQQLLIALSADAFAKIIDDTDGDIARINALEVQFSEMLLVGQSFSFLGEQVWDNRLEQLLCLSWNTNVRYGGKESVAAMIFETELSFYVVQTQDSYVTTLNKRFRFDHLENMHRGSHSTVAKNMWRELYKRLWGADLNTLKKREARIDATWQDEFQADEELYYNSVPCLEYGSTALPVNHNVIVEHTVEGVPLQIALQRVAGSVTLQDNITLEQCRLDNAMKFERYRLEYQDEYTKRKQLDAIAPSDSAGVAKKQHRP